jgi:pyruvate kinase
MIGDHHGWVADTATLLLTAMDEILGTHRAVVSDLQQRR